MLAEIEKTRQWMWIYPNQMPNSSGVYLIRGIGSKSVYIGSSKCVHQRINEHISSMRRGKHSNRRIMAMFNKYGLRQIQCCFIEGCETGKLIERESFWIKSLDSYKNGLNALPDAIGSGHCPSEETRAKISKAHKGKKLSAYHRELLVNAARNRSKESRMAAAEKMRGRKRSKEAIEKTSMWHRGKKRGEQARMNIAKSLCKIKIEQVPEIDRMITEGIPYSQIAKYFGVSNQTICNVRNRSLTIFRNISTPPPPLNVYKSEEHKKRISEAHKGFKPSQETRIKMSLAGKGRKFTEEHKQALKESIRRFHENKKMAMAELDKQAENQQENGR